MTSTSQDWASYLDPTLLALGSSTCSEPTLLDLAVASPSAPSPTPSLASSSSGSVGGLGVGDPDDFSPLSPLLNLFRAGSFPFPSSSADVELAPVPTISPVDAPMLQYNNSILVGSPSARSTISSASTSAAHQSQQAEALSLASWVIEEHGRSFAGGKASTTKSGARQRASSSSGGSKKEVSKRARGASVEEGAGEEKSDKGKERMGWLQRLREAEKAAERRGEGSPRVRW
ncbi:hypothetical protein BCR35DRAFT_311194 [Leucosporidium creatinivorum]|uniref:Uncharacterized protein n=1 Tax=Leucosporidium creatinivorum TaxID=106004 RepID=A0A1Y2CA84_9BASI|nr:hypothetical protein BCR35DRAFT_311194 [Leucosporidium creatinivorum]